jgi:hypothetical protein
MRVSVVVTLYNKAQYLKRCLQSICAQTFSGFELIVVDDGSTDAGEQIARTFGDARIRLIQQQNAGPGAARNRGLAEAQGEYVAFLDADDEWLPDYLSRAVIALDTHPTAASTTCQYREYPTAKDIQELWRTRAITEGLHRITEDTDPVFLMYAVAYMHPCTTLARASVLKQLSGFYDRDRCLYAEDAFLFLQVALHHHVHFSLEPLTLIYRDAAQLSGNLAACRPMEPFLAHPELVQASCPPDLRQLLQQFLAVRAFKTACVFGFWGNWREARRVRLQYWGAGSWKLPHSVTSLICATAVGSLLGAAWRRLRRVEHRSTLLRPFLYKAVR